MTDQTPDTPEITASETPTAPAATAPADVTAPAPAPRSGGTPPDGHWWWGTGRRKSSSSARVRVRPGSGTFLVNDRPVDEYFKEERDRQDLNFVLETTNTSGRLDIRVNVHGGGYTGQAGAIILGLGRAILRYDSTLEPILRDHNFLSRDPRRVERKKYGQPGARARFQFSKR